MFDDNQGRDYSLARDGLIGGGTPAVSQPGQSETLGPLLNGTFQRKVDLLRLQNGVDPLAMAVTIALGLSPDGVIPQGGTQTLPPVKALLTFGVGGTRLEAEIDFINGAVLTVPASSVTLSAVLDTELPNDQITQAVRVSAVIGYLPSAHRSQRTLRVPALAAAASAVLEVPTFAKSLTLLGNIAGWTFTLEQSAVKNFASVISTEIIPVAPPHVEVPLANDTRYVRITNGAGAPVDVRAIFNLSL